MAMTEPRTDRWRTTAIIAAQELTLDQQERQEIAHVLVGHEGSWSNLDERDARLLAFAFRAFIPIQHALFLRRTDDDVRDLLLDAFRRAWTADLPIPEGDTEP